MDFTYTETPVATLYNLVLKSGRSELAGISHHQVALTFDGGADLDVTDTAFRQAQKALDWNLDTEENFEWVRLLANLRRPGKEKFAAFLFEQNLFQFFHLGTHLNLTAYFTGVNLNDFDKDVSTAQQLLKRAAKFADLGLGEVTLILGWSHLPWGSVVENGDVEERLVEF